MRALVFVAAGAVEMRDTAAPQPAVDEELVDVRATAICGSELHGFRSVGMRVPPLVMGHEFAGLTAAGRRVVINPLLSCRECAACLAGRPQLCDLRGLIGVSRAGGFAESVAVPSSALVTLPDAISFSHATLVEPLANAIHAVGLIPRQIEQVGIIGAGPIGLLCAEVARRRGAEVTLAEVATDRRELAERQGFATVDSLRRPYDAVIDAVGNSITRAESVARLSPGGTTVWLGLAAPEVTLDGNLLVRGERQVVGSFAYAPAEFAAAVELIGELDNSWVSEYPFAQAADVFYALAAGDTSATKAVLIPEGGRA